MKSPIDVIDGRIVDYDEKTQELIIRASYTDHFILTKREYSKCEIRLIDGRPLSHKQRKAVYALLREISNYTGVGLSTTKDAMKLKFLQEELCEVDPELFSLSDAPVSLVCAFQRYIVRFMLEFDIPCNFALLGFVDDTADYLYACLLNKKCCICGGHSDLHHLDHVGMGVDREEEVHEGMEVLPLCRGHHTIAHVIGQQTFNEQYHIEKGVILDKNLCKIYDLKTRQEVSEAC